ncbi:MAG: HU family DNA-binding protein [Actinomycetota bacterium]
MNRSQFLRTVSERTGAHKRDVEHVWEHSLAVIQESIRKGEKVSITGFGIFKQRVRKAGKRKNPQTGETIKVPAAKLPKFLPAKQFKLYVGGGVKALPAIATKPVALAAEVVAKAAPKKAAAKKPAAKKPAAKAAPKKAAAKKPAAKAAPKKAAAKKPAAKAAPKKAAAKKK